MQTIPEIPYSFYIAALPVLLLCVGSLISLLQSAYSAQERSIVIVLFTFLGAALLSALLPAELDSYLGGAYLVDSLARFGQIFMLATTLGIAVVFHQTYLRGKFFQGEIASLYQMIVAGMVVLVSSNDLITFFIGLELSSIGAYALVGYIDPSRRSQEAAIKYFILGSFASACLLFGFGLLYASTGSLNLAEIAKSFSSMATHSWIVLGGLFTLVGLGFKLSLVPFHSWTADAYDGAPTGITAMMAISMKAMILIFSLRFLSYGMTDLGDKWLPLLLIMAILSMLVGNIMALVQSQIKRMLAYSSIAHSGYMAIALCVIGINDNSSSESVLFYLVGYSLASFASFAVLMWLESEKASHLTLDDLGGLVKTHPWSAITLAICMFSLAGIPPTVGFIGKFFVFSAAVGGGFYGLVIIGAIGSTISLYYYLRLIVFMFMKDKLEISPIFSPSRSFVLGAVIFLAISATMLLGTVLPGAVVEYLQKPAASLSLEN